MISSCQTFYRAILGLPDYRSLMLRGLLFDLDGTLVDSLPGIASALNLSLAEYHLPPHAEEEVKNFIGDGALKSMQRALSPENQHRAPELLKHFQRHYASTWHSGTAVFPGFKGLLQELHQQGLRLGVLSNKAHQFTVDITQALFEPHLFDPILGYQEGSPRKPDPTTALEIIHTWGLKPEEVAYVGDSVVDLETAQAAGMVPAIVAWGYRSPENWPLLETIDDLRSFLAQSSL